MPDEYDAIRRGLSNYERGLYFELGRAYIRGETADRGWVRQFKIETGKGSRIIDSARTEGLGIRAVERKSGRLNEREAREQLIRERAGIDSGKIARSDWETVAGEKIPRSVSNDMHALSRDFPGKFNHQVISRTDALRAIQVGRTLASKQLELVRVYELDRADRARKRLQNIREIVRQRERARELERQRERDERRRRAKERLPRVREAAERLRERRERQQRTRERLLLMRQTTERIRLPEPTTSGQRGREEHEALGVVGDEVVDARAGVS
ncbi:hypothetical protein [Nocardia vermiculata]|uniref:Uncharacterized protein n=2 Tax=Nocardia vermiculata TaxID=257274 RepID=A0A846XY79_9NOCA|nr:hypothetical protein [Nocardia vermiculata]NKY50311.1 hypothetical protein [Nocardia vermiculata]